jgi:hypothetical protein
VGWDGMWREHTILAEQLSQRGARGNTDRHADGNTQAVELLSVVAEAVRQDARIGSHATRPAWPQTRRKPCSIPLPPAFENKSVGHDQRRPAFTAEPKQLRRPEHWCEG